MHANAIRTVITIAYKNVFRRTITQYEKFTRLSASPRFLATLPKDPTQNKDQTQSKDPKNMVDPHRVVSYEDMLKVIHQPEKVIIDVRNPDEIITTGKIPSSINIPLNEVQEVLSEMPENEFKRNYKRNKPSASDELIFYCQSGRRSCEALDKALKLGYSKSKTYLGSWNDWSSKQR